MIPKIIHYIWLGGDEMPELVQRCISSWRAHMPEGEWTYRLWNEATIADYCSQNNLQSPLSSNQYCCEALSARKYAFVSDYIRLWALEREGGLYMDVDFEVYKSFGDLLNCSEGAFVGREGSKHQPPMLGVMASEPHGQWVTTMLHMYDNRSFIKSPLASGRGGGGGEAYDLTTNVSYFAAAGVHKPEWVHIYPVDYFCPVLTTGEDVRTEHTYCEHKGLHSWSGSAGWKNKVLSLVSPAMKIKLIKLKRRIVG